MIEFFRIYIAAADLGDYKEINSSVWKFFPEKLSGHN
jgi:hypothetical protein